MATEITSVMQSAASTALKPSVANRTPTGQERFEIGSSLPAGQEAKPAAVNVEDLRALVEQTNQSAQAQDLNLAFSINETTGTQMIQVFDRQSKQLIRQYPPEAYIGVAEQIQKMNAEDKPIGLILKDFA